MLISELRIYCRNISKPLDRARLAVPLCFHSISCVLHSYTFFEVFVFFLCSFHLSRLYFHPIPIRHHKLHQCSVSDQLNLIILLVSIYLQSVSLHTPTAMLSITYTPWEKRKTNLCLLNDPFFLLVGRQFNLIFQYASLPYQCHSPCGQVNNYIVNHNRGENESEGKHDLKKK